jgi:hypothetical protein
MTSYTVTITPDDPDLAVTTIRLDITDSAAAIRELRLVPGSAGGLTPGRLPVLDMNQLVAAVLAATVPGSAAEGPMPSRPSRMAATPKAAAKRAERSAEAAPVAKTVPSKTAAKRTTKATSVAKRTAAKKTAAKKTAAAREAGGRTYRRVPDDFDQVLRQAGGSASIVADHYGVPRHTAYSWIRSARKKASATS